MALRLIVETSDVAPLDPALRDAFLAALTAPAGALLTVRFAGGDATLAVTVVAVEEDA